MSWKPCIIISLVFFGIGVIFGYIISGNSTLGQILSYVPIGLAILGGFEVVSILREWFRERTEKRKTHAKLLYSSLQSLTNKIDLGTLPVQSNTPSQKYSKEVEEHLRSGYLKDSWDYKKERDNLILMYNPMIDNFINNITGKIKTEINQKIPSLIEWNEEGQKPTKYFSMKYISLNVKGVILCSYNQMFEIGTFCHIIHDENRWKVYIDYNLENDLRFRLPIYQNTIDKFLVFINATSLSESDNESEMLLVKQIIITVLKSAFTGESYAKIKECYEGIKRNDELFVNSVEVILKKIDNDIPLKGKCTLFGY